MTLSAARLLLLPLCASLASLACGEPEPPARRPDVVVVLVDTLRCDRTACLSRAPGTPGAALLTPELAAWGRGGTRYSQAIAPAAWTLPSMASLFSGLDARAHAHPDRSGLTTRHGAEPDVPTLAERFAASGYRTVGIVANPLLTPAAGFARGFDEYLVAPPGTTDDLSASVNALRAWDAEALVARALTALAATPRDRPLFLYLHLMDAHVPYDPANAPLAAPEAAWTDDEGGAVPLVGWTTALAPDQRELLVGWRGGYDGQVAFADRALGRLFSRLDALRGAQALVAVTADHGEGLFTHLRNADSPPGPGPLGAAYGDHGEQLYEEALRVPLWLVGPGVPAARDETRPVALRDLGRTLLDLAGLEAGGPRLPLAAADEVPTAIFGVGTRGWFVRSAERKLLIPFPERADAPGVGLQLFAVGDAPIGPEQDDLAATEPAQRDALLELWRTWRSQAGEDPLETIDPTTLQAMEALGYLR